MNWTTLPLEILETILTYLDLDDIKALRLASRLLAGKCVGPRFLGFIQQPTLDLSQHNVCSLYALACNPELGKTIHTLTFVATGFDSSELEETLKEGKRIVRESNGPFVTMEKVPCSPEHLSAIQSQVDWLAEQRNARNSEQWDDMISVLAAALKRFGNLAAIQLDGAIIRGGGQRESTENGAWHPLWIRASQVFYLVISAVGRSGVSVKRLDAYRNTPRCSLPSGDITLHVSALSPEQLKTLGASLESLELSMSTEVEKNPEKIKTDIDALEGHAKAIHELFGSSTGHLSKDDPRAWPASPSLGIVSLLKTARNLRRLDLHFRHALEQGCLDSYDEIFGAIAHDVQLPLLEECSLSGFLSTGEALLLFLEKHPQLRQFTLRECRLTAGSFTPVFTHLGQSMPELESLHLSNLFGKHAQSLKYQQDDSGSVQHIEEGDGERENKGEQEQYGLVNLCPVWDTDELTSRPRRLVGFVCFGGYHVHTRNFNREELKKGLIFRPKPRGRPLGSFERMWWYNYRNAVYGAP